MAFTASGRLMGRVCAVAEVLGALGEGVARRLAQEGGVVVGIDRKDHGIGALRDGHRTAILAKATTNLNDAARHWSA